MSDYVLDGIVTSMTRTKAGGLVTYECPCGWRMNGLQGYETNYVDDTDFAALRFHHTHCPWTKATDKGVKTT
jgi:hypothetical protein